MQKTIKNNKKTRKFSNLFKKLQINKFSIHPLFLIMGVFMFVFGKFQIYVIYTSCVLLHELGHLIIAKKFGYTCNKIKLMPFGAVLEAETDEFVASDEIYIALAGPMVNVVLCLLCVLVWWIKPVSYYLLIDFAVANAVCGLFNLIPIFPLDGGRIVLAIFSKNATRKVSVKIVKSITIAFSLLLFFVFIISLFIYPNFSIGIMAIMLFTGAGCEDKNTSYKRALSKTIKVKKLKFGLPVKGVMVDENMSLAKIFHLISFNHYNFIYVSDSTFSKYKMISESDLENLLFKFGANAIIKNVI